MDEPVAISLRNVSKCFKTYKKPSDRLLELMLPTQGRANEFWALEEINLDIPKGSTVGIIGRNGSGKSTLLQLVAGTLTPTSGEVRVKGRVSALLELGSGFNPEFTGRQNVFFNGRLLGLSQAEIEAKFDEIAAFADIGHFIDEPTKTYSSGMFVRLAFAVAVNVDPEILIVDEALAVGDIVFQHRCMRRMRSLMDSGVTTLFVSHDAGSIKTLCNSAVMLHEGKVREVGDPNVVTINYLKLMTELELGFSTSESPHASQLKPREPNHANGSTHDGQSTTPLASLEPPPSEVSTSSKRRGSGKARIESIQLLNALGEDVGQHPILGFNEEVRLQLRVRAYTSLKSCIVGFYICDKNGYEIIGSNTFEEKIRSESLEKGEELSIRFQFKLPLRPNSYSLTVAGSENYGETTFDWIDDVIVFQLLPPDSGKVIHALIDQPMTVEVKRASGVELPLGT
jgi:lipopolysaccharide transport system ATP-binding protein